ncbi:hypothetical protein Aeqsu_0399 [Aequorivita sublithincola DSM 14238]|uniref:Lacal_2735 family protein n=1 Tax=Aequorivita sublithincola (strain DSM 14238 / LMG 21431 / ACAM 643 / 9-3) TaxID=746697 RepID=I3YSE4_AEQSU|nr:hypothetical protein Aeqsu_0399 [Aequorivita sublithincola DSM 14238]
MISWFRRKSKVEILKEKYTSLMRRSFEMSIKDSAKSERLHSQADKLFREIQYLSLRHIEN